MEKVNDGLGKIFVLMSSKSLAPMTDGAEVCQEEIGGE